MNDTCVFVEGLELEASIGVLDDERKRRQPLVVDIRLALAPDALPDGTLDSTIDYRMPAARARSLAAAGHVDLVETFVERLAAACLEDVRVASVTVRARKPRSVPDAAAAGVEITRRRGAQGGS